MGAGKASNETARMVPSYRSDPSTKLWQSIDITPRWPVVCLIRSTLRIVTSCAEAPSTLPTMALLPGASQRADCITAAPARPLADDPWGEAASPPTDIQIRTLPNGRARLPGEPRSVDPSIAQNEPAREPLSTT